MQISDDKNTLEYEIFRLYSLAQDNLAMLSFLDAQKDIVVKHIDEKCGIFSFQGSEEHVFKYVVHPLSKLMLDTSLQSIALRGLKNQMQVRDIPGVQRVLSRDFYYKIPGLLGPFVYLDGFNLSRPDPEFSNDPSFVKKHFEDLESTLKQVHERKILHCDVKPGNIVFSRGRLYLIDWSLAVNWHEHILDIQDNLVQGTVGFLYKGIDRSRDYFALGVSLARVLIPGLPLRGIDVSQKESLDVDGFETDVGFRLRRRYGPEYRTYFYDLMHRAPEFDIAAVLSIEGIPLVRSIRAFQDMDTGHTMVLPSVHAENTYVSS